MLALSEELVRRGNRVFILVDGQRFEAENRGTNPAIFTWPSKRPVELRDARFLRRLIRRYHPDCLVATFGAINVMMLIGWLLNVPCRVAWRNTISDAIELETGVNRWMLQLLRLRRRWVYRLATHLVANSKAVSRDAQEVFGVPRDKCSIFYNLLAEPLGDKTKKRKKDRNRVVCVGRLTPTKGQDILIQAIGLHRRTLPDIEVEFVGDGPTREALFRLAHRLGVGDRCTFHGSLPHEQVLERMRSAVVTVVPSRYEGFGYVNVESMAVATPVIASRTGGIVEIIRDGIDGFLVSPEDPDTLAEKLRLLLTDRQLAEKLGRNGRERFLSEFELGTGIRRQAQRLERMVEDSLGASVPKEYSGTE